MYLFVFLNLRVPASIQPFPDEDQRNIILRLKSELKMFFYSPLPSPLNATHTLNLINNTLLLNCQLINHYHHCVLIGIFRESHYLSSLS